MTSNTNIINIEPDPIYIRSEYLYQEEDLHLVPSYEPAFLATIKSIPGRLFEFECFIPAFPGLRDKLPLEALLWKVSEANNNVVPIKPIKPIYYSSNVLQRWEAFDHNIEIIKKTIVENVPVECTLTLPDGSRVKEWGIYKYTIDTIPSDIDLSFVTNPTEHKSFNFIQLDNGQFALLPNNLCRFYIPSLTQLPPQELKVKPAVADKKYYPLRLGVTNEDSYYYES